VGVNNPPVVYSRRIQEWVVDFWQAESLDPAYRDMLSIVLTRLWSPVVEAEEQNRKLSLLTLPTICCVALGKDPEFVIETNAAWALVYAAFNLLDKVEEQEASGELFTPSLGVVTNVSTGFLLTANLILSKLITNQKAGVPPISSLQTSLYRRVLAVCAGQHLDLTQKAPDLEQVWHSVAAKSGEFFSLGCWISALLATENLDQQKSLAAYGRHLGYLIQIANDIEGLWGKSDGLSDLVKNRMTLPVAYAFSILESEKLEKLSQLLSLSKDDSRAETEARRLILGCGALIYLLLEAERHQQMARTTLESLKLPAISAQPLFRLLDQVVVNTG